MSYHCQVIGCSNGSYRLLKWKASICEVHKVPHTECVTCEPPFSLHPLPTRKKKPEQREKFKRLISRTDTAADGRQKLLSPSKDARVCSVHFKDKRPTQENPFPTQELGYPGFPQKVARVLTSEPPPGYRNDQTDSRRRSRRKVLARDLSPEAARLEQQEPMEVTPAEALLDRGHEPVRTDTSDNKLYELIISLVIVLTVITMRAREMYLKYAHSLVAIVKLTKEVNRLKKRLSIYETEEKKMKQQLQQKTRKMKIAKQKKSPQLFKKLITDKNVSYYTGLCSKELLQKLHGFVVPFVQRRWQGGSKQSKPARTFQTQPSKFGPKRFLDSVDELLLVLMRLRLGLDLADLADRFFISTALAGRMFTSWISALASTLGKALVYMPDRETVTATKPKRYRDMKDLMCIIDCTEFFLLKLLRICNSNVQRGVTTSITTLSQY